MAGTRVKSNQGNKGIGLRQVEEGFCCGGFGVGGSVLLAGVYHATRKTAGAYTEQISIGPEFVQSFMLFLRKRESS